MNSTASELVKILPEFGPLILCGEPGLGKTTELGKLVDVLEATRGRSDRLLVTQARVHDSFADFRMFLSASLEWSNWRASDDRLTLVIDGVDEGMIRIPLFVANLTSLLTSESTNRLRLILCCRSAEWPESEGDSLFGLWRIETPPIYELSQLRREDVRLAAEGRGYAGIAFLDAVYDAGVVSLAARPITLLFLLNEFEDGRFKATSHRQLYENGCRRFCDESNYVRVTLYRHQPTISATPQEKLDAAKRLGCLFLLGGKSSIHRPNGSLDASPSSALRMTHAMDGRSDVSEHSLLESLKTGLFTSRGNSLFIFTHQTFAECLAGQELAELPLEQLRTLLCATDHRGEHVIPQLAELASWVAGYCEEFFEHLRQIDPGILLRSDVSVVDPKLKSRLIRRILDLAEKDEFFDDSKYNRFWQGLDHPDLPLQIGPILSDRKASQMARRVAISIAEACLRPELIPVFKEILDDHNGEEWLRGAAASALCSCMPNDRLVELEPLARGEVGPDPNSRISGFALKRLVPSRWTVAQAISSMRISPNTRFRGGYSVLLRSQLPQLLTDADLLPCLRKLRVWKSSFAHLSDRRELSLAILFRSLGKIDEPKINKELIKLWRQKSRNYRDFFAKGRKDEDGLEQIPNDARLKWVTSILNDPKTSINDDVHHLTWGSCMLVKATDLEWTLRELQRQPSHRVAAWVRLAQILCSNERELANSWDLFIETLVTSIQLSKAFAWFKPIEIDSPEGRRSKANWLRRERHSRHLRRRKKKPEPEEWIVRDLSTIRNGGAWAFRNLCYSLSVEPGQTTFYGPLSHDLTNSPGWKEASDDRRAEILRAARNFLLECSDGYQEVGGRSNYSDPGVAAIWLLREEIDSTVQFQEAIAERWIDAITGDFNADEEHCKELFALAYRLNPEKTIAGWLREAHLDSENHGFIFSFRRAEKCFDSRLLSEAVNFVASARHSKVIESGIKEINELDNAAASQLAINLMQRFLPNGSIDADLLDATIVAAIAINSADAWPLAFKIMEADDELAKRVLLEACDDLDSRGEKLTRALNEEQLAGFYLLLCRIFPPSEDPKFESGFVMPRQAVVHVRGVVISSLAAKGTDFACEQLLRLAKELPVQSTWILWRYKDTLEAIRRNEWIPSEIETLTEILSDSNCRLLQNEDDLTVLILESLKNLQKRLTEDDLPAFEDLWQWEGGGHNRRNFRHRDEEAISDYVARWLRDEIGATTNTVVNREVQPERGKKTDILVQAWSKNEAGRNRTERPLSVTIEVKGCWNDEIASAPRKQLVDDYLEPYGRSHGIYLVAWFHSPGTTKISEKQTSKLKFSTLEEARDTVAKYVDCAKIPGIRVEPFVLDARLS